MAEVVAFGELLIDFTEASKDKDGYPTLSAHPGGAPANYLAALTKYGVSTAMIGKVGNDTFGQLLIKTLADAGIGTEGLVKADDVFTTLAFVTLDEQGNREFAFSRKPGADTCIREDEVNYGLIDGARVLHFGTLSLTDEPARGACKRAVEYAAEAGKLISFDPNYRKPLWSSEEEAREQFLWGMKKANIVKISDEELSFYFGSEAFGEIEGAKDRVAECSVNGLADRTSDSIAEAAEYIFRTYDNVKLLFITCGAEGAYYASRACFGFVPALRGLDTVDTTGAGDIFGGSIMSRLIRTESFEAPELLTEEEIREAVEFATAAAGLSTTAYGGISSVAEYDAVMEVLKPER